MKSNKPTLDKLTQIIIQSSDSQPGVCKKRAGGMQDFIENLKTKLNNNYKKT